MGADFFINGSQQDPVKEIMRLTDGRGVDAFFEMSGAQPSFEEGFKVLRPGGTAILFGLPSKKNLESLDRKSTRLNSSHGYISYAVFCLKKKKKHYSRIVVFDSSILAH